MCGVARLLVDPGTTSARDAAERDDTDAWNCGGEFETAVRKEWRYLTRSPARRAVTIVGIVLGTGFVLLRVFQNGSTPHPDVVLLVLLAAIFALSAVNNVLGHDGASLWVEVVAGGPRRPSSLRAR